MEHVAGRLLATALACRSVTICGRSTPVRLGCAGWEGMDPQSTSKVK